MSFIDEARKTMQVNQSMEKNFLLYNASPTKRVLYEKNVECGFERERMRILFELLENYHEPVLFHQMFFMPSGGDIDLMPNPRFLKIGAHYHDFLELLFVVNGTITSNIEGKNIVMHGGDICVLHQDAVHTIEKAGKNDIAINILVAKSSCQYYSLISKYSSNIFTRFLKECFFYKKEMYTYLLLKDCIHGNIKEVLYSVLKRFNVKKDDIFYKQLSNFLQILFLDLVKFCESEDACEIGYRYGKIRDYIKIVGCIEHNLKFVSLNILKEETGLSEEVIARQLALVHSKSLEGLARCIRFEKIYLRYAGGENINDIARCFNYKSEKDFLADYEEHFNRKKIFFGNLEEEAADERVDNILDVVMTINTAEDSKNMYEAVEKFIENAEWIGNKNPLIFKTLCIEIVFALKRISKLYSKNSVKLEFDAGQDEETDALIDKINSQNDCKEIVLQLKEHVNRQMDLHNGKNTSVKINPLVEQALTIIESEYQAKIQLGDVAKRIAVNASYLSRIIRNDTGKSFTEIVNFYRIRYCEKLLLSTSLSIAEISDQAGFSEYAYFYQVFTKAKGMSPGKYRKIDGMIEYAIGKNN